MSKGRKGRQGRRSKEERTGKAAGLLRAWRPGRILVDHVRRARARETITIFRTVDIEVRGRIGSQTRRKLTAEALRVGYLTAERGERVLRLSSGCAAMKNSARGELVEPCELCVSAVNTLYPS
jgi:hypothetical protein